MPTANLDVAVKNMSVNCYFQQISPQIVEKLKLHPSIVDLFREAYTLKEYAKDYWQGIEELQEEWASIDEELGEQSRITREIYEQIQSDIHEIVVAGLVKSCWVGSYDFFDWLETEGLMGIEIGNKDYSGYLSYLIPEQVCIMMKKLQQLQEQNFIEAHKILYPQSYKPQQNETEEADFWKHLDRILEYCQEAVNSNKGMILMLL